MPRSHYALFCPRDHRRPGTNQVKRNTFTREENSKNYKSGTTDPR